MGQPKQFLLTKINVERGQHFFLLYYIRNYNTRAQTKAI